MMKKHKALVIVGVLCILSVVFVLGYCIELPVPISENRVYDSFVMDLHDYSVESSFRILSDKKTLMPYHFYNKWLLVKINSDSFELEKKPPEKYHFKEIHEVIENENIITFRINQLNELAEKYRFDWINESDNAKWYVSDQPFVDHNIKLAVHVYFISVDNADYGYLVLDQANI